MIELHYYKNTNSIMKWVEVNEVVQIEKTAKFFVNHRETFAGTFLLQRLYCAFFLFFRFFVFFFAFLPRKIFIDNSFCLFLFNVNQRKVKWDIPLDIGRKLNVHKTFRRGSRRLLNVLCTFNLRPLSRESEQWRQIVHYL